MQKRLNRLIRILVAWSYVALVGCSYEGGPALKPVVAQPASGAALDVGQMPDFPARPPRPCDRANISMSDFRREDGARLGNLDRQIRTVLGDLGYQSLRYFRFRDGFAIVTQVERYETDGRSSAEPNRFVTDLQDFPNHGFNLRSYLTALFTGKTGQYRLFVFTITGASFEADPATPLTIAEVRKIQAVGWTALPKCLAQSAWTEDVNVEVLVYELETREAAVPRIREPQTRAYDHLTKSGIMGRLKGNHRL